jgi:peptidoglycan/xylan/chitin deacetylase (PgdA/CDA1 family)
MVAWRTGDVGAGQSGSTREWQSNVDESVYDYISRRPLLMIRFEPPQPPLSSAEQYAADTILDASRVLRAGDGADLDVVRLRLVDRPTSGDVASIRAGNWLIESGNGEVRMSRQLLSAVARWLGGAEQRSSSTDRYGRVPPDENPLVHERAEREPVVAHIAAELRRATIAAAGRRAFRALVPWPNGKRWAAAFTHDLDAVAMWPVFTALRMAELLKKADVGRMLAVTSAALRSIGGDPVRDTVNGILAVEREASVRSTWFIICGTPTYATRRAGDITYLPESPAARAIVRSILDAGHEVGLHGSFETYDHGDRFVAQRRRLEQITGTPVLGVRQHYLRMRPGTTQREMGEAELRYDSTYGFADRNGFRLGLADVVETFDVQSSTRLAIDEVPFVWMDRALSKYRKVESPDAWIDDALALASVCRETGGLWAGIWHPNLSPALGFPGAPEAYARLVRAIVNENPHIDTLAALVAWRRARRAARATAIDARGRVIVESIEKTAPPSAPAMRLEGPAGEPRADLDPAS